jgi:hypothetical protein
VAVTDRCAAWARKGPASCRPPAAGAADRGDLDTGDFSVHLVSALAAIAHAMAKDLAEPDWLRILDALLLIATHPTAP